MKKTIVVLLCLCATILVAGKCFGCSGSPMPYFGQPSYIDPDFKVPSYAYDPYERRNTFGILLDHYATYADRQGPLDDSYMRENSAKTEPERYSAYCQAAQHFREEKYDSALYVFKSLADRTIPATLAKADSWVTEASTYMVARCQLILSQNNWDGYHYSLHVVDQSLLQIADSSYRTYLASYPDGLYASSARNIFRKIYYLSKNQTQLDRALKEQMLIQFPSGARYTPGMPVDGAVVAEFLNNFRGEVDFGQDSPMLLAFAWLGKPLPFPDDLVILESREKDFASYTELFRFLRALGLYRLSRYQELLDKTPESHADTSKLWLSTQILRVHSFEKLADTTAALAALQAMYSVSPEDQVIKEIATLKINSGNCLWLFSEQSPITDPQSLRAFALAGLTNRELVRGLKKSSIIGSKRQILANELAKRYLLLHRFTDLKRILDSTEIPLLDPIIPAIAKLAGNPEDVDALVELGVFMFDNFINPLSYLDEKNWGTWGVMPEDDLPQCEPCKALDERISHYEPPMSLFRKAVRISRRANIRSDSEAKALHYIVRGGRYGHWKQRCTWYRSNIDVNYRNAFIRLHRLYPDSPWTAKTPYWYK